MMKTTLNIALALFVAAGLAGCGSIGQTRSDQASIEDRSTSRGLDADAATTRGMQERSGFSADALSDPNSPLSQRTIYFEYDSTSVKPQYQDTLRAHADYLAENPGLTLTLQGHADERGSREYNLALGERRAVAVQRLTVLLGAGAGQLSSTSYGEEKPVAYGHDESSWNLNRRVELVY